MVDKTRFANNLFGDLKRLISGHEPDLVIKELVVLALFFNITRTFTGHGAGTKYGDEPNVRRLSTFNREVAGSIPAVA